MSRATAAEIAEILAYRKFRLSFDEQLEALAGYLPFCEVVDVVKSCPILCRDVKDQPLLDLAQSGEADILVTGDEDLLVLTGQTRFVIETPETYRHRIISDET
jgi:putative PIN family toxin of toxin-antitoxin system